MGLILKTILSVILVISVIYLGFELYKIIPQQEKILRVELPNQKLPETNASSELAMFMPNMRFNSDKISYSFYENCEINKKTRVETAFRILSTETKILQFYEIQYVENNLPDILIYCYETKMETDNSSSIAGEGGPKKIINSTLYPLIIRGEMNLYNTENTGNCPIPVVELHELLHVFGFDHINDENSVLYPYVSCKQNLTQEMISSLQVLYSIPPKADNSIKSLEVSKAGSYLNFEIEVENNGLIDANDVNIKVYDNKKSNLIKQLSLEKIIVGTSKTLSVQNIMLSSRSTNEIKIEVVSSTTEYNYENNVAIAYLE